MKQIKVLPAIRDSGNIATDMTNEEQPASTTEVYVNQKRTYEKEIKNKKIKCLSEKKRKT